MEESVAKAIGKRREELGSRKMTLEDVEARKIQGEHHLVIGGMVFDVGTFLRDHPGGQNALLRNLGHDATAGFLRAHGSSAHPSLVKLFYADIVNSPSPTKISLPPKLEVRDTSLFGRVSSSSSSKSAPFQSVTAVDLQLALGEQSTLAGVSMLSIPPQNTVPTLVYHTF